MTDREKLAVGILCDETQTPWTICDLSCRGCKFYVEDHDMGATVPICSRGYGRGKDSCDHYMSRREYLCLLKSAIGGISVENDWLRGQVERLQPKDCEGNVLDIADTVSMLRSEYDGDHEWDDVVVELVLTKWGGDRWIVRGSKGEAWACDCLKTGYDEDAYEGSGDAEPIADPSLVEVENAKLRDLLQRTWDVFHNATSREFNDVKSELRDLGIEVD